MGQQSASEWVVSAMERGHNKEKTAQHRRFSPVCHARSRFSHTYLNVCEEDIVEVAHGVDDEQLVSHGHEVEVDALHNGPEGVVDQVGGNEI